MKQKLVIYGAGEIGRFFVWNYIKNNANNENAYKIEGFIDDCKTVQIDGYPILGTNEILPSLINNGITNILISFLHPTVKRLEICLKIESLGFSFPSFLNKDKIPPGIKIGKGVIIDSNANFLGFSGEIGDFSVIGPYAIIEGGVKIERGVFIGPQVFIGYETEIGEATAVFPKAYCRPKIKIGKNCEIWPGVFQNKSLPDNTRVIFAQKRKFSKIIMQQKQ